MQDSPAIQVGLFSLAEATSRYCEASPKWELSQFIHHAFKLFDSSNLFHGPSHGVQTGRLALAITNLYSWDAF